MTDAKTTIHPTLMIGAAHVECWRCKRVRPSLVSINIMDAAASLVPSVIKPVCDECAPNMKLYT